MNGTLIVNHQPIYEGMSLRSINAQGRHLGTLAYAKGCIASCLHWNDAYDQRQLLTYYIEWKKANPDINPLNEAHDNVIDGVFRAFNEAFQYQNLQSTHLAQLIEVFGDNHEQLNIACKVLEKLEKDAPVLLDIETMKEYVNQMTDQNRISTAIRAKAAASQTFGHDWMTIRSMILDCFIYEVAWALLGAALGSALHPILTFLIAGALADLAVTFVRGLCTKGVTQAFDARVSNQSSWHPFIEATLGSLYITVTWELLDTLEKSASPGGLLKKLITNGFGNYVLKYSTMNLYFAAVSALVIGQLCLTTLTRSFLTGGIRGGIKNNLLATVPRPSNHYRPIVHDFWSIPITVASLFVSELLMRLASRAYTYCTTPTNHTKAE